MKQNFKPTGKGISLGPSWTNHWWKVSIKIPAYWSQYERVQFEFDPGCEAMIFSTGKRRRLHPLNLRVIATRADENAFVRRHTAPRDHWRVWRRSPRRIHYPLRGSRSRTPRIHHRVHLQWNVRRWRRFDLPTRHEQILLPGICGSRRAKSRCLGPALGFPDVASDLRDIAREHLAPEQGARGSERDHQYVRSQGSLDSQQVSQGRRESVWRGLASEGGEDLRGGDAQGGLGVGYWTLSYRHRMVRGLPLLRNINSPGDLQALGLCTPYVFLRQP